VPRLTRVVFVGEEVAEKDVACVVPIAIDEIRRDAFERDEPSVRRDVRKKTIAISPDGQTSRD